MTTLIPNPLLTSSFQDLLLSAAPVESHVGAIVDSPNACVTLALPLGIFEHVRTLPYITSSGFAHLDSPGRRTSCRRKMGS
jgi:hypothetical protein